ncbi:hypothetical protein Axy16_006 [Achromobacter phage vB_AxyS_19-32_Axy16]|nr:hypothetical protein Axy16_006 [Achromobacter phage vB_AxyS_19-32_Axy16]
MDRADIEDLQRVRDFICNELALTDEMQLLVSQIELRIATIEVSIEE